jgi:hypothetical protein
LKRKDDDGRGRGGIEIKKKEKKTKWDRKRMERGGGCWSRKKVVPP